MGCNQILPPISLQTPVLHIVLRPLNRVGVGGELAVNMAPGQTTGHYDYQICTIMTMGIGICPFYRPCAT